MKRPAIVAAFALAAACGSASGPSAAASRWTGTWTLVSDNGVPVPADIVILGYSERVVSRTLTILSDGTGIWADSSTSALNCIPPASKTIQCNSSGGALVSWFPSGDTLIVARVASTVHGYVTGVKAFAIQSDGSLLKTDDSQVEVYRRKP